ncbi:MAG: FitA-like ribbon-helix-helix domain-containing protein, partial [Pseudomonadota bacterium]
RRRAPRLGVEQPAGADDDEAIRSQGDFRAATSWRRADTRSPDRPRTVAIVPVNPPRAAIASVASVAGSVRNIDRRPSRDIVSDINAVEADMGQVIVRNLDDAVVAALKARAKRRGHSLERELREVLKAAARPTREQLLAEVQRVRAMTPPRQRIDIEKMIREDRSR